MNIISDVLCVASNVLVAQFPSCLITCWQVVVLVLVKSDLLTVRTAFQVICCISVRITTLVQWNNTEYIQTMHVFMGYAVMGGIECIYIYIWIYFKKYNGASIVCFVVWFIHSIYYNLCIVLHTSTTPLTWIIDPALGPNALTLYVYVVHVLIRKYRHISNISCTESQTLMLLISSYSCLCWINWNQVLNYCSNYIWMMNIGLTVLYIIADNGLCTLSHCSM